MARPSVLRSKTLPQGQFTCPEDVKSGVPAQFKLRGVLRENPQLKAYFEKKYL